MTAPDHTEISTEGHVSGAHPTAPGGMSEANLRIELAEKHGVPMAESRKMSWPEKINRVIAERRAREIDAAAYTEVHEFADYDEAESVGFDGPHPDEQSGITAVNVDDGADLADVEAMLAEIDPDGDLADEMDIEAEFAAMSAERDEHEATLPPPLFLGMPDTNDFIFSGHAGAGPSGAERWMNCTASLGAVRAFLETLSPNQQREFAGASTAARQGTTAHAAAEVEVGLVMGTISPEEAEASLLELTVMPDEADEAYDTEMAEYITEYVDFVKTYVDAGHEVLVESRVESVVPLTLPIDPTDPDTDVYVINGSADFIAMPTKETPVLTVGDLKYGNGLDVEVDENPQIRIYALGALSLMVDDEGTLMHGMDGDSMIEYAIIQPRLGGIKVWTETVNDLLVWRDEVLSPALTAALLGERGGATFAPSDLACQWCPVRGSCAALTEQRVEQGAALFDAITEAEFIDGPGAVPDASTLTDTRLGEMLSQVERLVALKDDLKAEAQRRLHRGGTVPGYHLVNYTPPRKWAEGATEDETLANLPVWKPQTLLSPTQAVKVLGDEAAKIESLIVAPDKKPVVARIGGGNKNKPWTGTPPEQMFPDLPEEG